MPCVLSMAGTGKYLVLPYTLLKWCTVGEEKEMGLCLLDFRKANEEQVCVSVVCRVLAGVHIQCRGVRIKWSSYECLSICVCVLV